jgi:hypothetical protein
MLNILKPIINKMNRNGVELREVVIEPINTRTLQPETPKLSEGSEVVDTDTVVKSEIPIEDISDFQKYYRGIKGAYHGEVSYESITLDLVAIYLKGQKLLYIESKTFCEQCLYHLMLPAIFISAVCTVISVSLRDYFWGNILVASLTGLNSFILSVVTYLKLDAKSEAHRTASYQFDKLQTECEFHSGRALLVKESTRGEETISTFVKNIEKKVIEIKDVNQFVIPELIRHRYSTIYGTNVFAIVKKYKTDRMVQAQRLLVINKKLIAEDWYKGPPKHNVPEQVEKRSVFRVITNIFTGATENVTIFTEPEIDIYTATEHELRREKDRLINLIIEYRKISSRINDAFNKEIQNHINRRQKKWMWSCSFLKT